MEDLAPDQKPQINESPLAPRGGTPQDSQSRHEYSNFDKNALFETFKKENLKTLLLTESSQRILRGGIATIIAMLFFFIVLSFMLSGNANPTNVNVKSIPTPTQIPTPTKNNSAKVETKIGNPLPAMQNATNSPTVKVSPTIVESDNPMQKSQYYEIAKDLKELTFIANYSAQNLEVEIVVTDPKGNTYTKGDESKYGNGVLTTKWGTNSREIKISNTTIEKGMWKVDLFSSRTVQIDISLTAIPK